MDNLDNLKNISERYACFLHDAELRSVFVKLENSVTSDSLSE
jgi:hypothetical protein